jgi:STE24 endopeptidase
MPLLSILVAILAIQSVAWPPPMFGGAIASLVATFAVHAGVAIVGSWVSLRVSNLLLHRPEHRRRILVRHAFVRLSLTVLNILAMLLSMGCFGWGWTIWTHGPTVISSDLTDSGQPRFVLMPMFELVTLIPYFVTTLSFWLGQYRVEKTIRETSVVQSAIPFYSRLSYVLFHGRMYAMLVMLPAILTAAEQSFARMYPEYAESAIVTLIGAVAMIVLIVLFPLLVPYFLGLVPMFPGPMRDRMQRLASRTSFRTRDFLVWPTRATIANALIIGLIPQARYVIFSDKLLDQLTPDELDAVCGHEIGHVHHGHILYYGVFLGLSGSFITGLTSLLSHWLLRDQQHFLLAILPIVALGVYLFVVFGFLSRRCERQADLFGCASVSCGNPTCTNHDDVMLPDRVGGLCPTGIRHFTSALDNVIGGGSHESKRFLRRWLDRFLAWQHGPPSERIDYLLSLIEQPQKAIAFQRRFFAMKVAILVILIIANVIIWSLDLAPVANSDMQ